MGMVLMELVAAFILAMVVLPAFVILFYVYFAVQWAFYLISKMRIKHTSLNVVV